MNIALLDAAVDDNSKTKENFERVISKEMDIYDISKNEFPYNPLEYDKIIITGSGKSVNDDEKWIKKTEELIEKLSNEGIDILGICWGHQAVAKAMGGEITRMETREIGYKDIEKEGDSKLLDGIDNPFLAFETHEDTVESLENAPVEVIATNEYGIQSFEGENLYGVQFHPEYDLESANRVVRKYLDGERKEDVLAQLTDDNYELSQETKKVFDNFLSF